MAAPDYCTSDQVKAEVGITDSEDDPLLSLACSAASRQIEGECGWRFWQDPAVVVQYYYPDSPVLLDLLDDDADPISTTTGLIVQLDTDDDGTFETTLTINTDFRLHPENAANRDPAWPWTSIVLVGSQWWFRRSGYRRPTVKITAKFGWPAVPDDVSKAAIIQAAQLYKAKDAVFGAIALGDTGAAMRVRSGLNPLALGLLSPYMRPRVG